MNEIEDLLDRAAREARNSVRTAPNVDPSAVVLRSRRRRTILVSASVLLVGLLTAGGIVLLRAGGEVADADGNLITSEIILEDGVVTEDEYRAGARAFVACLETEGIEAEVSFDGDFSASGGPISSSSPKGHASFFFPNGGSGYLQADEGCMDLHLSRNVSLGWADALGQIDLEEVREEDTATTACVEERTGLDFGELTYNEFGYLTREGQQTRDAAFEYQDHQPWGRCRTDLGYEESYQAETRALVECVEAELGMDFGRLEFDDTGHPTEEGQATLQAAITVDDHRTWEACQTELGIGG